MKIRASAATNAWMATRGADRLRHLPPWRFVLCLARWSNIARSIEQSLESEGLARHAEQAALLAILPAHWQAHELATDLCQFFASGQATEALSKHGDLHTLHDERERERERKTANFQRYRQPYSVYCRLISD